MSECKLGPCGYHCNCYNDIDWDKPGCQWCQLITEDQKREEAWIEDRAKLKAAELQISEQRKEIERIVTVWKLGNGETARLLGDAHGQVNELADKLEAANRLLDEARTTLEYINKLPGGTTLEELIDIRCKAISASFTGLVLLGKTERPKQEACAHTHVPGAYCSVCNNPSTADKRIHVPLAPLTPICLTHQRTLTNGKCPLCGGA